MLRLLADENFNGDIIRGVLLRKPGLDLVRVQDVGLLGSSDEDVLAWARQRPNHSHARPSDDGGSCL